MIEKNWPKLKEGGGFELMKTITTPVFVVFVSSVFVSSESENDKVNHINYIITSTITIQYLTTLHVGEG